MSKSNVEISIKKGTHKSLQSDKFFYFFNYIFLALVLIITAVPLLYIVCCSFSGARALFAGKVFLLPVDFTLENYKFAFRVNYIWQGYMNTIIYTVVGTIINVIMTILCAYPLSRKDLRYRNFFTLIFTFTMFFGGGLIPLYIVIRSLHMIDTIWAVTIPGAISVWNVIMTKTFFQSTIPNELLEASKIDGCTDFKFILKVVVPLSGAITAVNVLFYAVGHWNDFMGPLIYFNNISKYPLQLVVRTILLQNDFSHVAINQSANNQGALQAASSTAESAATFDELKETIKYSLIIVASLPVLIIYPFAQKYFIKGIMIGSIKG